MGKALVKLFAFRYSLFSIILAQTNVNAHLGGETMDKKLQDAIEKLKGAAGTIRSK